MERRVWGMAIATMALGILPIAVAIVLLLLGMDFFLSFPFLVYVLPMVGGMLSVVFAFTLKIRVDLVPDERLRTTASIARAFRLAGFTVVEDSQSVTVAFDKWTAIKLAFDEDGGAWLKFRLDATRSTLFAVLLLFFLSWGIIAIPFCVFLLIRTNGNAMAYVPWVLKGEFDISPRSGEAQSTKDIRENLIDSLSEVRRVARDAYWSMHSAMEDAVILSVIVVGMIGGLVLFALLLQTSIFDPYYRVAASLLAGLGVALTSSIILAFWLSRRMKPKIEELDSWVTRLDLALLRERKEVDQDGSESSIELLFNAFNEMPRFLKARRKSMLSRYPATQILVLVLVLWGSEFIAGGLSALLSSPLDLLPLAVGLVMVSAAILLYRWSLKKEHAEEIQIAQEWEKRREYIRSAVEDQLGGI